MGKKRGSMESHGPWIMRTSTSDRLVGAEVTIGKMLCLSSAWSLGSKAIGTRSCKSKVTISLIQHSRDDYLDH